MFQKLINLGSHSRSTYLNISFFLLFLNRDLFKGMIEKVNDIKGIFLEGYLIGYFNISPIDCHIFTSSCKTFYYALT